MTKFGVTLSLPPKAASDVKVRHLSQKNGGEAATVVDLDKEVISFEVIVPSGIPCHVELADEDFDGNVAQVPLFIDFTQVDNVPPVMTGHIGVSAVRQIDEPDDVPAPAPTPDVPPTPAPVDPAPAPEAPADPAPAPVTDAPGVVAETGDTPAAPAPAPAPEAPEAPAPEAPADPTPEAPADPAAPTG